MQRRRTRGRGVKGSEGVCRIRGGLGGRGRRGGLWRKGGEKKIRIIKIRKKIRLSLFLFKKIWERTS